MSKQYKLLIVDDEKQILDALETAFLADDIYVQTIDNPITALGMIKAEHFHVVISDIAMPQMSGLDLLRQIKQYNAFIQVIMITGYITVTNALNAFRYGASDCFFKPFENPDQIIASVYECVRRMERVNNFIQKVATVSRSEVS